MSNCDTAAVLRKRLDALASQLSELESLRSRVQRPNKEGLTLHDQERRGLVTARANCSSVANFPSRNPMTFR